MLFLAKAAGIAILIWFYLTAKEKGEPAFKWAIIGLIGYWIAWWVVKFTVVDTVQDSLAHVGLARVILYQIPAFVGIGTAVLVRKKLIADASGSDKS